MNDEIFEEKARFFEFITTYEFINEQGWLDLEAFCVNLSTCFSCDGVLFLSPQPRDVHNLLLEILGDQAQEGDFELWVRIQKLVDWTPEVAHFYPDKYRTLIHGAPLVKFADVWIYNIGHTLMDMPEPVSPSKYFGWVDDGWVYVHTFLNRFHECLWSTAKNVDKRLVSKNSYSHFEALHRTKTKNLGFGHAAADLKNRNMAHAEAMARIDEAIDSGFNIEAIVLQECLMGNYLYNYLCSTGVSDKNVPFWKLISLCEKDARSESGLLVELDKWRKKRNKAVHGFIEARVGSYFDSQYDFLSFSKDAAKEGRALAEQVGSWYLDNALEFFPTDWPDKGRHIN